MREEGNLVVERAAEQKLRRRAQSAVAGDAVLERMVSWGIPTMPVMLLPTWHVR